MSGFLYYRKADKKLMGNSGYPAHQIPYASEEDVWGEEVVQEPKIDPETGQQTVDSETGELLFDTVTRSVVIGTRPITRHRDFTGEDGITADVLPNFGGVLADYSSVKLTDKQMAECYSAASYVVQFDGEAPIGVTKYAWATLTCPRIATVGVPVDISVSAEGGGGVEAILYIDGVEQARGPMPSAWQVQFDNTGTYLVEVNAGRHGVVRREVAVS